MDSNVAQLLIVSELTIAEGAPRRSSKSLKMSPLVERACGAVCDRCRRIEQQLKTQLSRCHLRPLCKILEENFAEAVQKALRQNKYF